MMMCRLEELPPNERMQTHRVQLSYLNEDDLQKSYDLGYHSRTASMGRVYAHDRTPEKKIDRTNKTTDIRCSGVIMLSNIPKHLIFRNAENERRYLDKLTFRSVSDGSVIYTGSICIDDIPKEEIKTDNNTGKKYINATFKKLERLDTYMNTHQLVIIDAKGNEIEIGRFKEWQSVDGRINTPTQQPYISNDEYNDKELPESIDGIRF